MTVTEFRFVVLDDPVIALLSIGGIAALLIGFFLHARGMGGLAGRRLMLTGAVLLVAAVAYTLVASWLTSPTP